MIRMMTRHKLIAVDALQPRVQNGPLRRHTLQTPLRLLLRQRERRAQTHIHVQRPALDKDATPDNGSGFRDALQRTAAEPEVHRRLPLTDGFPVTISEVRSRRGAGNLE